MSPDILIGSIKFNDIILWILALATVISVLETNGFLPKFVAKWFARNRLESTIKALQALGVRATYDETDASITPTNKLLDITKIKELAYKKELRGMLLEDTFTGDLNIGATTYFQSTQFIDVIGSSTNPNRAVKYAKLLHTHAKIEKINDFDIIATPRSGSPILGYEFARLCQKPFIVDSPNKVNDASNTMGAHANLDFPKNLILKDKVVLIVDDSTTGGRKQIELANLLRTEGAKVEKSLILFEPKGKGAREKLALNNIELHSIIDGPTGRH